MTWNSVPSVLLQERGLLLIRLSCKRRRTSPRGISASVGARGVPPPFPIMIEAGTCGSTQSRLPIQRTRWRARLCRAGFGISGSQDRIFFARGLINFIVFRRLKTHAHEAGDVFAQHADFLTRSNKGDVAGWILHRIDRDHSAGYHGIITQGFGQRVLFDHFFFSSPNAKFFTLSLTGQSVVDRACGSGAFSVRTWSNRTITSRPSVL